MSGQTQCNAKSVREKEESLSHIDVFAQSAYSKPQKRLYLRPIAEFA
jgi:hypothetical protein